MLRKIILIGVFVYAYTMAAAPNVKVTISWKLPVTCGTGWPACSYVVSRVMITGTTCPDTSATIYTPLNAQSPTTLLAYVDSIPKNSSACYVVQTKQMIDGQMNTSIASGPLAKIKVK
jgi:hypothetical protein